MCNILFAWGSNGHCYSPFWILLGLSFLCNVKTDAESFKWSCTIGHEQQHDCDFFVMQLEGFCLILCLIAFSSNLLTVPYFACRVNIKFSKLQSWDNVGTVKFHCTQNYFVSTIYTRIYVTPLPSYCAQLQLGSPVSEKKVTHRVCHTC